MNTTEYQVQPKEVENCLLWKDKNQLDEKTLSLVLAWFVTFSSLFMAHSTPARSGFNLHFRLRKTQPDPWP